mgnify:CR=1 FL=1
MYRWPNERPHSPGTVVLGPAWPDQHTGLFRASPRAQPVAHAQPNNGQAVPAWPEGTATHRAFFELSLFALPHLSFVTII